MTTATRTDRTSVNGVPYKRVAEILRAARDLMNNNGRHWVKGEEKIDVGHVDPKTHFVERGIGADNEIGEYAFCSIGAVAEICGKNSSEYDAVLWELAKVMNPHSLDYAHETYYEHKYYEYYLEHGYEVAAYDSLFPKPDEDDLFNSIGDLDDTIATINDDEATRWEDVRSWFTKAAARAAKKK